MQTLLSIQNVKMVTLLCQIKNFKMPSSRMGSAILCLFFHQRITRKNGKNGICRHSPLLPTEYQFKVSEGKKKQYTIVKKHLDEADTIIIATDGDREGEAIARLIINLSGNNQKQLKRLWINSLENRF